MALMEQLPSVDAATRRDVERLEARFEAIDRRFDETATRQDVQRLDARFDEFERRFERRFEDLKEHIDLRVAESASGVKADLLEVMVVQTRTFIIATGGFLLTIAGLAFAAVRFGGG